MAKQTKIAQVETKDTETERAQLERQFMEFANEKGWDEDRRLQVLIELSHPEPWSEMLDKYVEVGWTDGLIEQLHQYYGGEEDYFSRLLAKLIQVEPKVAVDPDLIGKVVARLNGVKSVESEVL
jgi:hypothetical protein